MKKITLLCCLFFTVLSFGQIDYSVKFKITAPNGHTDETIVRLEQTATPYFDGQWDAWKIFTWNDSVPSIFSQSADSFAFAINAIPFMTEDTSLFLSMRVPIVGGMYQMETEQLGDYPPGIQFALKDLENNVIYPLNSNQVFNFNVMASALDFERFELFYSAESIIDTVSNSVIINNQGAINWTYEILDESSLTVDFGTATSEVVQVDGLENGTYLALITDDFNLIDSVYFDIVEDEVIDEDPPGSSVSILENENSIYIYQSNGEYYLRSKGVDFEEVVRIDYYSFTGQLLKTEYLNSSEMDNYALLSSRQPMLIRLNSSSIKSTLKIVR